MELYTKTVSPNGKVKYLPYTGYTPSPEDEITDAQLITLAVSIGVTCLNTLERQLKPHSRNARHFRAMEEAIFKAAQGHGAKVDPEMVNYWIGAWNGMMAHISACKPVPPVQ